MGKRPSSDVVAAKRDQWLVAVDPKDYLEYAAGCSGPFVRRICAKALLMRSMAKKRLKEASRDVFAVRYKKAAWLRNASVIDHKRQIRGHLGSRCHVARVSDVKSQ